MTYRHSEWIKTRFDQIAEMAATFNISVKQALAMRHNFIDSKIKELQTDCDLEASYLADCGDELEFRFYLESMAAKLKQISKLERSRPIKSSGDDVTDDDIQEARKYPIGKLVEFKRGKIACPFHDDKNPSAFHGTRTNTLVCPVCAKTWDSISILQQRDGYQFLDAVRQLARG